MAGGARDVAGPPRTAGPAASGVGARRRRAVLHRLLQRLLPRADRAAALPRGVPAAPRAGRAAGGAPAPPGATGASAGRRRGRVPRRVRTLLLPALPRVLQRARAQPPA